MNLNVTNVNFGFNLKALINPNKNKKEIERAQKIAHVIGADEFCRENIDIDKVPKWIKGIFNSFDRNKNGVIDEKEAKIDREKYQIGTIYKVWDGMNFSSFLMTNYSVFKNYIAPAYQEGRQIMADDGKLHPTDKRRKYSQDIENTKEVLQGTYTVKGSDECDTIQTFGIGPCVALTIYDKENKRGFLTHIDTSDKAKSLKYIIPRLKSFGMDFSNCEARIIGGQTGMSEDTIKIIEKMVKNNDIPIVEMDVLGHETRCIQLDLKTGEVTDYTETIHLTSPEEFGFYAANTFCNDSLMRIS